jgi:hypothetical protein
VMALYAEGFSVANYLVNTSGKPTFLAFVADGMNYGWDHAVQSYYRYNNVDELEQAWLTHLRNTRRNPTFLAQNARPTGGTPVLQGQAEPTNRVVTRQTAPPVQPSLPAPSPIFRGKSPETERWNDPSARLTSVRPGYLPDYVPPAASYGPAPADGWRPANPPNPLPQGERGMRGVQLGSPQAITPASPPVTVPPPAGLGAPVGYPQ